MQRNIFNFILAVEAVLANKLRAFLTGLGIVFGVGAVIAMLAIGYGAKQSILEQMKLIGTNNIVIEGVVPEPGDDSEESGTNNSEQGKQPWSPGLRLDDMKAIQKSLPTIEKASPEINLNVPIIRAGKQKKGKVAGVMNAYFDLNNLRLERGRVFHPLEIQGGQPVCIIEKHIQFQFFQDENPVGKRIKCGKTWLTVIGVLEPRSGQTIDFSELNIKDYKADVYIPVTTVLIRFENRALVTSDDIGGSRNDNGSAENYHQLDRLVVQVNETEYLEASANVLARLLKRRHNQLMDVDIKVPTLLLEQQQKTQETFNFVLAIIAGISLLVGGIGIMNIMLASVLERIKEIGVRRSLGATRQDIISQFLFEAVFISLLGGLIGVLLGVGAAKIISSYADIPTIVSAWSIILSFGVAASVGLIFGIFPARKAARQDPIKALRTE